MINIYYNQTQAKRTLVLAIITVIIGITSAYFTSNKILTGFIGLGLAKFDLNFAKEFGCNTKTAFNKLAVTLDLAKTEKAVSNRQDSFDPYFDNGRKGWWQRNQREHVKLFIDSLFGNENVKSFANIVKLFIKDYDKKLVLETTEVQPVIKSKFKQLQITGNEAEFFFMSNYKTLSVFEDGILEDARLWGDGYDFQIQLQEKFVLAEIKGVRNKNGAIRITQNEFDKAEEYKNDYFIVVVSNLSKTPQLNVIENPLKNIKFNRRELNSTQINYHSEHLNW